jgi:hypothetical protein
LIKEQTGMAVGEVIFYVASVGKRPMVGQCRVALAIFLESSGHPVIKYEGIDPEGSKSSQRNEKIRENQQRTDREGNWGSDF